MALIPLDGYPTLPSAARRFRVRPPLIALLIASLPGAASAAQADAWCELRTPNFVVSGDAPREELRLTIDDLESFRSAVGTLFRALPAEATIPTSVVVFKDSQQFARFLPRDEHGRPVSNIGGFFLPGPDTDFIVFGAGGRKFDRRIVLHEYAHRVLHRSIRSLPLWLNEGLAEFYSTFEHDSALAPAIVGRPPTDLLSVLHSSEFVPLYKIVDSKLLIDILADGDRARVFYAESWALVHYLLIGRPGASNQQMAALMDALMRGVPPKDAFASACGVSLAHLDNELRAYVRQDTFRGLPVDVGSSKASRVTSSDMSPAAVKRLHGELLLRVGTIDEAQHDLAESLAIEPSNVDARVAMARVMLATGQTAEGRAALQQIVAEVPGSFAAQYYLGGALSYERDYEAALIAFDSAVRLRDTSVHALFAFSSAALAVGLDDTSEAAMDRLMELEFNPDAYRTRAYSALGLGRDVAAAEDARRYIDAVGWREPAAQSIAFVAVIAYWRSNRPGDAAALLEQVRAAAPSSSWAGAVAQFMEGRLAADRLIARAKGPQQKTAAHTYIGLKEMIEGHDKEALVHFRWVEAEGTRSEPGYAVAIEELVRIESAERR